MLTVAILAVQLDVGPLLAVGVYRHHGALLHGAQLLGAGGGRCVHGQRAAVDGGRDVALHDAVVIAAQIGGGSGAGRGHVLLRQRAGLDVGHVARALDPRPVVGHGQHVHLLALFHLHGFGGGGGGGVYARIHGDDGGGGDAVHRHHVADLRVAGVAAIADLRHAVVIGEHRHHGVLLQRTQLLKQVAVPVDGHPVRLHDGGKAGGKRAGDECKHQDQRQHKRQTPLIFPIHERTPSVG